jgi:SDR family mycofactocin-dependent oxidoreductase
MARLTGKVAFITGAARGQGRSHAIRFAEEGADVVALDICEQIDSVEYALSTPDDLAETVKLVEELDRRIIARQADVRDRAAVQAVVDEGLAEFGRIDFVIANAGICAVTGEQGQEARAWTDSIDVLLSGVYYTIEAALPSMVERNEGGAIVITSSTAGLRGMGRGLHGTGPGLFGYTAAKHGVVGLMRLYANALAPHSIRVNTVHPTGVNTPMIVNEQFTRFAADNPQVADALQNALPVELIEPADVSNAVVWLCTDEARYITGTTLPVDAGICNKL